MEFRIHRDESDRPLLTFFEIRQAPVGFIADQVRCVGDHCRRPGADAPPAVRLETFRFEIDPEHPGIVRQRHVE